MVAKYTVLALALAFTASALQITRPSNATGWESGGSQLIEWDSVSTDPSNFTIQLITPSNPNDPITIAENVKSSDKSYIYTPASDLTAADQYRVNFVSAQAGILAQSGFFAVEQGTSTVSPTSAAPSSTASGSSTSGASSVSSGSSATSSAASASQSGSAGMLVAPTGLLALVAAALSVLA